MTTDIPSDPISEIYAIDKLNNDTNFNFPLAMTSSKKNKASIQNFKKPYRIMLLQKIWTLKYGNISVHTIDGKIIVPTSLQQ